MEQLKALLHEKNCSLVLKDKDGCISFYFKRGVADLMELLDNPSCPLQKGMIADKVIGKGAAAIMIAGGVINVHTDLISLQAKELFEKYDMEFTYTDICDHIINRDKTGWCPVETLCKESDDIDTLIERIRVFVEKMKTKN